MKFFVCFALIALIAAAVATPAISSVNQEAEAAEAVAAAQGYGDLTRLRKSAYGGSSGGSSYGASVPSPPCPKNYLFSCQPNLAPVPCSSPSYGSTGAYSSPVATYVAPNYGQPQYQHQQQLYGATYGYQY